MVALFCRKRRKEEEEENLRNKQKENNNTIDESYGSLLVDGETSVWVSSGNLYGGGTYVPIPPKSEHTYLSVASASTRNSNNKEADEDGLDTRKLILRYSGTSMDSSSPPSSVSSSSLMTPTEKESTTGYEIQVSRTSFPGSELSLSSIYGKDAGVYDSILTDLEPRYVGHAVADAPTKRRENIGHCM